MSAWTVFRRSATTMKSLDSSHSLGCFNEIAADALSNRNAAAKVDTAIPWLQWMFFRPDRSTDHEQDHT